MQKRNKKYMSKCQEETVKVFTPHFVSRAKEGMTGGTMAIDQLKGKHQVSYSSSSLYMSIKSEVGRGKLALKSLAQLLINTLHLLFSCHFPEKKKKKKVVARKSSSGKKNYV